MTKVQKFHWFILVAVYRYGTNPGIPNIMFSLYRKSDTPVYDEFGATSMEDALADDKGCEGMELLYYLDKVETDLLTGNQAQALGLKLTKQRAREMIKLNK